MTCLMSDRAQWTVLQARVAEHGLILRGGFRPAGGDDVPALPDGRPAATVILIGNAGPAMFEHFRQSPEAADGAADPLDRWSLRVIAGLARTLGAHGLFPFGGPPWHPFQRWAQRAEDVAPSPTGMLIHPDYGLWHAYRGALAFADAAPFPPRGQRPAPCPNCVDRPCLSTCPAGALTAFGYDVGRCRSHVVLPDGWTCRDGGCQARAACPVGQAFRYGPDQAAFHMAAFAGGPPA